MTYEGGFTHTTHDPYAFEKSCGALWVPMSRLIKGNTGVWEIFLPQVRDGDIYKYQIVGAHGAVVQKADPVGFGSQHAPEKASIVRDITGYGWKDAAWMKSRAARADRKSPISIYEVHLGSWRRRYDDNGRPLSYKELARDLVGYVKHLGFTHIELLPISEFPFDGSWGYQPVGLYIGVLLDWVPGHFPTDEHGLAQFDGTALYEHADPREGFHQDWNTLIPNYGRTEVKNYFTANALYWLEEYHLDGLRVDAVASMLYRDYSRKSDEWVPNKDGGRENYEAIQFLQDMNVATYGADPSIMTVAEESTSFPGVSQPVHTGGLGFGYKWNMGWMNDTLRYMEKDPIYRQHDHHLMTFPIDWAFTENFILPISHDEVVHGKGSMISNRTARTQGHSALGSGSERTLRLDARLACQRLHIRRVHVVAQRSVAIHARLCAIRRRRRRASGRGMQLYTDRA